jgi:C_GCAxxG_C_C family probable redox protein
MTYTDKGKSIMACGLNCAQAVAGAFAELYDTVDLNTILNLTSPLGGGFGRKRELCGAVTGMGIAFGAICGTHTGEEKMDTYNTTSMLADRFIERYGSIVCRDIVDAKPDEPKTPREQPLTESEKIASHWPCSDYVRGAIQILEEYLQETGKIQST